MLSNFCCLLYYSLLFIEFSSTINRILLPHQFFQFNFKTIKLLIFYILLCIKKNNNDSVSLSNPIYIIFLISDFFNKSKTTPTSSFISSFIFLLLTFKIFTVVHFCTDITIINLAKMILIP